MGWAPLDLDELADELEELEGEAVCAVCGEAIEISGESSFVHADEDEADAHEDGPHTADPTEDFDVDRYRVLRSFDDEIGGLRNNDHEPYIAEHDFEEFVEDDIPQIVEIPDFIQSYVDWERLAQDVAMDYSTVEFEGTTYYYR